MEKEINKEIVHQPTSPKNSWFAGYIVAGLIWYFAQSFKKNVVDEVIVLVIAILCGIFYHRIKSKIKLKNEFARVIVTFLLIEIVASALIGFLTAIAS